MKKGLITIIGLLLVISLLMVPINKTSGTEECGWKRGFLIVKDCIQDGLSMECYSDYNEIPMPDWVDTEEELMEWLRGLPTFIGEDSLYMHFHADSVGTCNDKPVYDFTKMGDFFVDIAKSLISGEFENPPTEEP